MVVIIAVSVLLFNEILFYGIIKIESDAICFYSVIPFKKNLRFEIASIQKVIVNFNDFSRGMIIIYSSNNTKTITVEIALEQKKLIKGLIDAGLNVE